MSDYDTVVSIEFSVPGLPLPKGSGSRKLIPMKCRRCGLKAPGIGKLGPFVEQADIGTKTRAPHALKRWSQALAVSGRLAWGARELTEKAIELECIWYLPKPASVKRDLPTVKPDYDKLARTIGDALEGIIWKHDSQITDGIHRKRYGDPGVTVRIRIIDRQLALL